MSQSTRSLVAEYVAVVGERRFDRLAELVHPEATFGGAVKQATRGAAAFIDGFRTLGPIIVRNEIRELIVEGERAAVLYDFVTESDAGAVLTAEFLAAEDGLIRSSALLFDMRRWPAVLAELERRKARASTGTAV